MEELSRALQTAVSLIDEEATVYNEISTYIWEHPELGLVEFRSSARLQEYLAMSGFRIQNGIAGMATAFSATWGAGKPVIGFLGEFDALPNLSQQAGSPIRKALVSGGPGHGCGHNLLGTSCAVAARATANAMKEHGFKGTVIFFGTPAEETLVGKVYMNRDGVFDAVDVMITWHPHDETGITCDSSLAMDNMKFRFHGKAAHAGLAPEQGRSALDAVELMNIGINFMREHLIQDARVHYVISRGGEVPNIVPAFAESWYFLRAPRRSDLDDIRRRMIDAAQGAALMTGTGMEWQLLTAVYERLPNSVLVRMGDKIVKQIGAPAFTEEDQRIGAAMVDGQGGAMHPQPFSTGIRSPDLHRVFPDVGHMKASGDFNYTWKIPSLSFDVAVVTKGTPLHSWQAVAQANSRPAQKAGIAACKYMAAAALECLADPQLVLEARLELNVNAAKFGYAEPIPPDLPVPTFKELYGFDPDNDTVSAVEPSAPKQ